MRMPSCTCVTPWQRNSTTSAAWTNRSRTCPRAMPVSAASSAMTSNGTGVLFATVMRLFPAPWPRPEGSPAVRCADLRRRPAAHWHDTGRAHPLESLAGRVGWRVAELRRVAETRVSDAIAPRARRSDARGVAGTSTSPRWAATTSYVRVRPGRSPGSSTRCRSISSISATWRVRCRRRASSCCAAIRSTPASQFSPAVRHRVLLLRLRPRPARPGSLLRPVRPVDCALALGAARAAARAAVRVAGRRPGGSRPAAARTLRPAVGGRVPAVRAQCHGSRDGERSAGEAADACGRRRTLAPVQAHLQPLIEELRPPAGVRSGTSRTAAVPASGETPARGVEAGAELAVAAIAEVAELQRREEVLVACQAARRFQVTSPACRPAGCADRPRRAGCSDPAGPQKSASLERQRVRRPQVTPALP